MRVCDWSPTTRSKYPGGMDCSGVPSLWGAAVAARRGCRYSRLEFVLSLSKAHRPFPITERESAPYGVPMGVVILHKQ
jgi:hypothetical protein